MGCGIYIIKNNSNNKVYIGSSVNLDNRKYKHFWMLDKGIHDNFFLQKSFNKYGKDFFEFIILEICDENSLIDKENFYITKYNSNNPKYGYNLAKVNDSRKNIYNNEVKVKLSKYNLNKNKNFSRFLLTNILTNEIFIFDNLVDCANYLVENKFTKGKHRNVRMKISQCLRGITVDNGHNGSIRKSCYKHKLKIIN